MKTFYIHEQKYKISLKDEQYYMFLGLKDLLNENEILECLKIDNLEIYDLDIKISIKKENIIKKIILFYNQLDKMIKLLKSIISFDIQSFQIIENLYNENNKNITIYNYFFNYQMYKHYKYEESKIICLIYEYMEKIDTNTLLFILGFFITFYKTI